MTANDIELWVTEEPPRRHAPEASYGGVVQVAVSQPLPMISEDEALNASYIFASRFWLWWVLFIKPFRTHRYPVGTPNCQMFILPSLRALVLSINSWACLRDLAAARVIRESQAVGGSLSSLHAGIAKAENALILQVFGGENQEVDKGTLRVWLVDGRLSDCWKSPKTRIGIRTTSSTRRCLTDVTDSIRNPKHTRFFLLGSCYFVPRSLDRGLRFLVFRFIL